LSKLLAQTVDNQFNGWHSIISDMDSFFKVFFLLLLVKKNISSSLVFGSK